MENCGLARSCFRKLTEGESGSGGSLKLDPTSQGVGSKPRLPLPWRAMRHGPNRWRKT